LQEERNARAADEGPGPKANGPGEHAEPDSKPDPGPQALGPGPNEPGPEAPGPGPDHGPGGKKAGPQ
jgi:hypothetical protein